MTRRRAIHLLALAFLAAAPGCMFDYPGWGDDWGGTEESNLSTSNPDMYGAVGDVSVTGDRAWVDSAYSYDGYAHIDLRARGEGGVIMQAIDIEGIDHPKRMFDVTEGLIRRGYTDEHIRGVLGGNFQRVLGEIWEGMPEEE